MKKNLLIVIAIAAALSACSEDDKKESKKGFDRTLPKSTALSANEIGQIKTLIKPISQISIEDLILYRDDESSEDKAERVENIEKKDPEVKNWIEDVTKNCQINLISETVTQTPDTDDLVAGKVVTTIAKGNITDSTNKNVDCGLKSSSTDESEVKYTEVDKKSDSTKVKLVVKSRLQKELTIKDQEIINKYKVNKISSLTSSDSIADLYYTDEDTKQSISAKASANMTYFKSISQDTIKIDMNILSADDHIQMAMHMFIKFSELSPEVVLSALMDSKNEIPVEFYLNGVSKTEQEIKEIFGNELSLPTSESSLNKMIRH